MAKRRKYNEQDKEEAFSLFAEGWTVRGIADEMNKRNKYKMNKSTVNRWALNENWIDRKAKVMKDVRDKTGQKATDSITRAIGMGKGVQASFIKQLKEGMEIRPHEAYQWTHMLLRLEEGLNARDILIEEVAQLSKEAMDKAGIPPEKQAKFAAEYSALMKTLKKD